MGGQRRAVAEVEMDVSLQDLFQPVAADTSQSRPMYLSAEPDLLSYLERAESLSLVAIRPDSVLHFPLDITSQDGHPAIKVSWPHIVERSSEGGTLRVQPARGDLHLVDLSGNFTSPVVLDISTSGILLRQMEPVDVRVDQYLDNMILRLPAGEVVRMGARVVRIDAGPDFKEVALHFGELSPDSGNALSQYIFRRFEAAQQGS